MTVLTNENLCAVNETVLGAVAKFQMSNQRLGKIPTVYIIVPDRFTLQAEKILTRDVGCLLNVRVLTFSMLFATLSGSDEIKVLDKTSAVLFMWRAIQDVRGEMQYFNKSVEQYAFAEKMFNTINQLQSCMADFDTLDKNAGSSSTKRKMHDVRIIYKKYQEFIREYIDGSGILGWLIENVGKSEIIKTAHVYVTGFEHLSRQRAEVVRLLARNSKSFTIGVQANGEIEKWVSAGGLAL